jgi:SAM-dependent methyltransferase
MGTQSEGGRDTAPLYTLEVIDVLGLPVFGGNVTAICRCHVSPVLAQRAEGDAIHLATHVRNQAGQLLIENGPRSKAIPPVAGAYEVAVPLSIPADTDTYVVELDSVVELKFWASWLGTAPTPLQITRLPDGSLRGNLATAPHEFVIPAPSSSDVCPFQIPHPRYGMNDTERCIEIPWTISRYREERRVLDIGYAFSEPRYKAALSDLNIPLLVGLDLATSNQPGLAPVVGDVRLPPFRTDAFDLIIAISVIEHVGRDNQRYIGDTLDKHEKDGDFLAIRALANLLAPGGRILLTVPFGAAEDHGWFIQYDAERVHALIAASGLNLAEIEYYYYADAWQGPCTAGFLREFHYRPEAGSASAVACIALSR